MVKDAKFTVFSSYPSVDSERYRPYDIKIRSRFSSNFTILKILVLLIGPLLCLLFLMLNKIFRVFRCENFELDGNPICEYLSADIIIDVGGDNFGDVYGAKSTVVSFLNILPGILLKKPIILFAESIGPFNHVLTRILGKFVVNRVNMVIVREELSLRYLKSIGIKKHIFLTADPAFLLKPAPDTEILRNGDHPVAAGVERIIHGPRQRLILDRRAGDELGP
nr:polysaccharide pyruvyl transferase family protein [Candidatus Sigynarchaeota archaeon]